MRAIIVLGLALLAVGLAGGERPGAKAPAVPEASVNAGKRGTYEAELKGFARYKYWVYVPAAYSADNPAGIHLYFHGQNGQSGASWFAPWKNTFCEPFNLIGINMQYLDGDNSKDTEGKIDAAQAAIAQVMADYKVVPRGVVSSFSGGGMPHSGLFQRVAAGPPTAQWPFTQMCLYSSNYRGSTADTKGMAMFISVGGKEWTLAQLGETQTARMGEVLGAVKKGGCPDAHLRIEKDKGHSTSDADVAAAARLFRRSDLAHGLFLHEASWTGKARTIATAANRGALGQAATEVAKALAQKGLAEAERPQLEALQQRIDGRIEAVIALTRELATQDTVLATYYGTIFTQQLKGAERAKELRELLVGMARTPEARNQARAHEAFIKAYPTLFTGDAKLAKPAETVPLLEQIAKLSGPGGQIGMMSTEFLQLQ